MLKNIKHSFFGLILLAGVASADLGEFHWDWSKIDTESISFHKDFLLGTAVSMYQVAGGESSNWATCNTAKDQKGKPRISHGQVTGKACDFWNHLDEDIQKLVDMKVKAFRFSIEWADIEPQEGQYDVAALARYHDLCDRLANVGIKPVVTLHHFVHPTWFEDKGAFEKEENITYFVTYAREMVKEFGDKVSMWATFNEPGVYVFQGYVRGVWPPFKSIGLPVIKYYMPELTFNFMYIKHAGYVLKNMLQAHVQAYQAIKKLPNGNKHTVGIVHSITQFDPFNRGDMVEETVCYYTNNMFHDAITQFFSTGSFRFGMPVGLVSYENSQATNSLDYFGINYYSHVTISTKGQVYRDHEIRTDMPYGIHAEGLYRSIADVSDRIAAPQGIPIYITENGIADGKDDRRELFIKRYMYALKKAVNDGYDVRGYFYWSLLDNFEWSEGYDMQFGLYEVDFKTQERKLRKGAQAYLDIIERSYGLPA